MSQTASERIPVVDVDQAFPAMIDRDGYHGSGPAVIGDQSNQVRSVLRDVLGLRTRTEDPKAFSDALAASFQLKLVEGHVEANYLPHSFAASDLGYISGGQASLYKRASVFGREITTILAGLRPLRPDADRDDVEAYRTLVRDAVTSTVDELGMAGGPRVELIDSNFQVLTGVRSVPDATGARPSLKIISADDVGGQLGALRERFGLTDENVNTPEEEGARTLYVSMVDMIVDLYRTWVANVVRFASDSGRGFLGTELVWLSRVMEAAADQVDELERMLDSVLIGAAERRTIMVNSTTSLTLDGLLSWLRRFLSHDGRRIIQDTGRDGIVSTLTPMALTLLDAYVDSLDNHEDFRIQAAQNGQSGQTGQPGWLPVVYLGVGRCELPAGMKTARVRIAIASLGRLLTELARGALRIGRWPQAVLLTVTLTPVAQRNNNAVEVVIRGLNLQKSYIPAFARHPLPDISDCNIADIDDGSLVQAMESSSTADGESVSGLFHFNELREVLTPYISAMSDGDQVFQPGVSLVLPAEDLPIVLIDDHTGRIVFAPPTVTYPSLHPADRPVSSPNPSRWDPIPTIVQSHGTPQEAIIPPAIFSAVDVGKESLRTRVRDTQDRRPPPPADGPAEESPAPAGRATAAKTPTAPGPRRRTAKKSTTSK